MSREFLAARGEQGPEQDLEGRRVRALAACQAGRPVEYGLGDRVQVAGDEACAGEVRARKVGQDFGEDLVRELFEGGHCACPSKCQGRCSFIYG